ncbi:toxin-antitoxin system HicB family antitoxin [Laspinema olomoucense]|uniref:toxin-antitoxin system HicB family antitoxin n=1 Tax=Laspinema olomoucense TaxID=3231600 RepID=UPI0021BB3520|nr:toxin-antitoxin system HicB family antitoxin [Laspinema sp. D3a]MCT7988999.1 toxin-antitoxin system HicB family antitoxin [Laspinema sp. D3a]
MQRLEKPTLFEDKRSCLKALAQSRGICVNKLREELSTLALAEFDAQIRFQALAIQGDMVRRLEILDRLDEHNY